MLRPSHVLMILVVQALFLMLLASIGVIAVIMISLIVVIVMVEGVSIRHFLKIVLQESMWIRLMRNWMGDVISILRISFVSERVYIAITSETTEITVFESSLFSFPFPLGFLCFSLPFHLLLSLLLLHLPLLLLSLQLFGFLIVSWLIIECGIVLMYRVCSIML